MYYGNEKIAAELEINYYDIRKHYIIIYDPYNIYSSKTSFFYISNTHTLHLSLSLLFTGLF